MHCSQDSQSAARELEKILDSHKCGAKSSSDLVEALLPRLPTQQRNIIEEAKMLKEQHGPNVLFYAVNKSMTALKYLVYRGADVNHLKQSHRYQESLLRTATQVGRLELVKYLVEQCGADILAAIKSRTYYDNALHVAASYNQLDVLRYYVQTRHIDVNSQQSNLETALFYAARDGFLDMVKFIVTNGGGGKNLEHKNKNNDTPLLEAALFNHLDIVKYLVEQGGDINTVNTWGWSLLHVSALRGNYEIVKYLIGKGISHVTSKDNQGDTPLHFAASKGHLDVVKYLIQQAKAPLDVKNHKGQTPLDMAKEGGFTELVQWLQQAKSR